MGLTNAFRDQIAGLAATAYASGAIGVGNGTTAFAKTQTDLSGASKTRKGMESGYPDVSGNVITFRSVFGSGDGNHAWSEWGVFSATSGGTMMIREVADNGTKSSSEIKTVTATITLTV